MPSANPKAKSSIKKIRELGITRKTAWYLGHRNRETGTKRDNRSAGPVGIDKNYISGKERDKHRKNKPRAGRATVGKIPVIGIRDRKTNPNLAELISTITRRTVSKLVETTFDPMAWSYTDDSAVYELRASHEVVNHSAGKYVRGMAHSNGIESFWALPKCGFSGTFGRMSATYLERNVNEFGGRRYLRMAGTIDRIEFAILGMIGNVVSVTAAMRRIGLQK